mmetsp:Transcript_1526/g.3714  ORF Transcript_1526/g.3714 Transcript_1526/m.3714 type:complete len:86 (-) Transcript_1526:39-296(-)
MEIVCESGQLVEKLWSQSDCSARSSVNAMKSVTSSCHYSEFYDSYVKVISGCSGSDFEVDGSFRLQGSLLVSILAGVVEASMLCF